MTYLATLAAIVIVLGGVAALVTGLPAVGETLGGAADAVADAGATVLDALADESGGTDGDGGADGTGADEPAANGNASGSDGADPHDGGGVESETEGSDPSGDGADAGERSDEEGSGDGGTATETDGAVVGDTDGAAGADGPDDGSVAQNVSHESPDVDAIERGLVAGINDRRRSAFVPALDSIYVDELWTVADDMTRDMATDGYVGTTAPDGTTATDRFERYDPRCDRIDDYEDALALAARLNYSTVVGHPTHNDTGGLVDRVLERWRDERGLVDDDYDDLGVSVRHHNDSDALYAAAAAC